MNITLPLIIHELLCFALFYSAFCRAVWTTSLTRKELRVIIVIVGSVACLGMAAPLAWGYKPDWYAMTLMAASVASRALTASFWVDGIRRERRNAGRGKNAKNSI